MGVFRNIRNKITAIFSAIMIGSAPTAKRAGLAAGMGALAVTQLAGCGAYENTEDLGKKICEDLEEAKNNFENGKSSSAVVTELSDLQGLDIPGIDADGLLSSLEAMVSAGDEIQSTINAEDKDDFVDSILTNEGRGWALGKSEGALNKNGENAITICRNALRDLNPELKIGDDGYNKLNQQISEIDKQIADKDTKPERKEELAEQRKGIEEKIAAYDDAKNSLTKDSEKFKTYARVNTMINFINAYLASVQSGLDNYRDSLGILPRAGQAVVGIAGKGTEASVEDVGEAAVDIASDVAEGVAYGVTSVVEAAKDGAEEAINDYDKEASTLSDGTYVNVDDSAFLDMEAATINVKIGKWLKIKDPDHPGQFHFYENPNYNGDYETDYAKALEEWKSER
ncbi:MAG TPA: hypothetical protein DEP51_06665 [Clostridiales bacterium]|nr:hypothetical protein [Clostridiales bacterium]